MELMAVELGCSIILVVPGPVLEDQLYVYRPMRELPPRRNLQYCYSCHRTQAKLAPWFSGCIGGSLSNTSSTSNREREGLGEYICGLYCWCCLINAFRNVPLENTPAFCYRCPACRVLLPVWVVELCFQDYEFIKR